MLSPHTPSLASRSRLGVRADSSSVLPFGSMGRPPKPSATMRTILVSAGSRNSRRRSCKSMAEVYRVKQPEYSSDKDRLESQIAILWLKVARKSKKPPPDLEIVGWRLSK